MLPRRVSGLVWKLCPMHRCPVSSTYLFWELVGKDAFSDILWVPLSSQELRVSVLFLVPNFPDFPDVSTCLSLSSIVTSVNPEPLMLCYSTSGNPKQEIESDIEEETLKLQISLKGVRSFNVLYTPAISGKNFPHIPRKLRELRGWGRNLYGHINIPVKLWGRCTEDSSRSLESSSGMLEEPAWRIRVSYLSHPPILHLPAPSLFLHLWSPRASHLARC